MRKSLPEKLEAGRVTKGHFRSDSSWGAYGCFFVTAPNGVELKIIASGGDDQDPESHGWEHVSVSLPNRCPNWPEMCFVKDLFWSEDECVVQFHPPKSEYVNNHPNCLHLWRSQNREFPMPPSFLVGVKDARNMTENERRAVEAWNRR